MVFSNLYYMYNHNKIILKNIYGFLKLFVVFSYLDKEKKRR
jgi:hypothetical protein